MRLVFEKFERSLALVEGAVSVLCVEDHALFSRCASSLMRGYDAEALEPAAFFDENNKELAVSSCLFVAGDMLSFDLNDKRIVALAMKKMVAAMVDYASALEERYFEIEELFDEQVLQWSGDYALLNVWDTGKYLKMAGFAVDTSNDVSLFDKACHLLRIAADLFPERVLGMVNLCVYLTQEQFEAFCALVAAEGLKVLLVETDVGIDFVHLQNRILVDGNYLEF